MAPTLFGRKTENCRTSGPPIFEVVSGKSTCMVSNSGTKNLEAQYPTVRLQFPTEFAGNCRSGWKPSPSSECRRVRAKCSRYPFDLFIVLILFRIASGHG